MEDMRRVGRWKGRREGRGPEMKCGPRTDGNKAVG
jgi:hypothetical protein